MAVEVSVMTVEPTPTAVVTATTTWAEFPAMWRPMLDKVWGFLRGNAPEGLYEHGHNIMLYKDAVPRIIARQTPAPLPANAAGAPARSAGLRPSHARTKEPR